MTGTTIRRSLATMGAGALAVVGAALPAQAGNTDGESSDGRYSVTASVTLSGDGAPGGGGIAVRSLSVPVACYWSDFGSVYGDVSWPGAVWFDSDDPEAALESWSQARSYQETFDGRGGPIDLPTEADIEQAVADKEAGKNPRLYYFDCNFDNPAAEGVFDRSRAAGTNMYAFYNEAEPTPVPEIDPRDLARVAYDQLELVPPQVDRNPRSTLAGSTLVRLPTWFWVTDPESVGGADGARTIRADVAGSGVWAEVTAETGGLSLTSVAGSQECSPSESLLAYAPGRSEAAACTVEFQRSSAGHPGGFDVTASTVWTAQWRGVNQAGQAVGGGLATQTEAVTVQVPVAESQALVNGAG